MWLPTDPEEIAWAKLPAQEQREILSAPWTTNCVWSRDFVEWKKAEAQNGNAHRAIN